MYCQVISLQPRPLKEHCQHYLLSKQDNLAITKASSWPPALLASASLFEHGLPVTRHSITTLDISQYLSPRHSQLHIFVEALPTEAQYLEAQKMAYTRPQSECFEINPRPCRHCYFPWGISNHLSPTNSTYRMRWVSRQGLLVRHLCFSLW